jgi:type IV secretion system protein VirB9
MNRRILMLTLALATALPTAVIARETPRSGHKDARMRTVVYDPAQVVRLSTVVATALVVTFDSREKIAAVAVTDSKNLVATPRDNFLFMKSRDILTPQPIIVLTKGPRGTRRYVFEVEAISAARQSAEQRDVYYSVEFRYPADRAQALMVAQRLRERQQRARQAQLAVASQRARVRRRLEQASAPVVAAPTAIPVPVANWRYVAQGNRRLAPGKVYDNGSSTFFQFSSNTRMPAIFRINPDGQEVATNVSVKNDWMIVGGVARGWRLRDGRTNLTIWNKGPTTSGATQATGTVSANVRRVMRSPQ